MESNSFSTLRRSHLATLSDLPQDTVVYELCPRLDLPSMSSLLSCSRSLNSIQSTALAYTKRTKLDYYEMLEECARLNYHRLVEYIVLSRFRTLTPRRSYEGAQLTFANIIYGAAKGGNIPMKNWALKRLEDKNTEGYWNSLELSVAAQYGQITYLENALEVYKRQYRNEVDLSGFPRFQIAEGAFQGGKVSVLEFLHRNDLNLHPGEFTRLARSGIEAQNLECIKYCLAKGFTLSDTLLNQTAAEIGNLEIVRFLVDKGCVFGSPFLRLACWKNHFHILKWFDESNYSIDYNMVATHAIYSPDWNWLKWLQSKNYRFETEHFIATLKDERKFRWLMDGGHQFDLNRVRLAVIGLICGLNPEVFKFWCSIDAEFPSVACDLLAAQPKNESGLVEDLLKLHKTYGCALTSKLLEATARVPKGSYMAFVEFCLGTGAELTEGCLISAAKASSWATFDYLLIKKCPRTSKVICALVEMGNLNMLKKYHGKGLPVGKDAWESMSTYTFDYYKNWECIARVYNKSHPSLINEFLKSIEWPTE